MNFIPKNLINFFKKKTDLLFALVSGLFSLIYSIFSIIEGNIVLSSRRSTESISVPLSDPYAKYYIGFFMIYGITMLTIFVLMLCKKR